MRLEVWAFGVALVACGEGTPAKPPVVFDAAPVVFDAAPVVGEVSEATGVAAWDAVVDRARYLERRGDAGAVVGVIGPATGPYRWLVDETEGQGALAIRVALPGYAAGLSDGERVQVRGAWAVDGERRWFWRAREVARVADPEAKPAELSREPGLAVAALDAAPEGSVPASAARGGADVRFAVVAPPVKPGDGWLVADAPGGDAVAYLVLPGEHAAYGGQDMLADDERWKLAVGRQYTVKVARRPRRSAGLLLLNASGPPREIR